MAGILFHIAEGYTPPDIVGFADMWFDAANTDVSSSGQEISTWYDSSVNGLDAVNAYGGLGTKKPKYYENEINGHPIVRFPDPAPQFASLKTANFALTEKLIIFIVYKPNDFEDNSYILVDNAYELYLLTQDPEPGIQLWSGNFGPMVDQPVGEFGVITCYIDTSSSWIRRNSGTKQTASLASIAGATGLIISQFLSADVAEIIVDTNSTLTDGEITEIEEYLLLKYGL